MSAFPETIETQAVAAVRRRAQRVGEALDDVIGAGQSLQVARSTRMIRKRLRHALDRLPEG